MIKTFTFFSALSSLTLFATLAGIFYVIWNPSLYSLQMLATCAVAQWIFRSTAKAALAVATMDKAKDSQRLLKGRVEHLG